MAVKINDLVPYEDLIVFADGRKVLFWGVTEAGYANTSGGVFSEYSLYHCTTEKLKQSKTYKKVTMYAPIQILHGGLSVSSVLYLTKNEALNAGFSVVGADERTVWIEE